MKLVLVVMEWLAVTTLVVAAVVTPAGGAPSDQAASIGADLYVARPSIAISSGSVAGSSPTPSTSPSLDRGAGMLGVYVDVGPTLQTLPPTDTGSGTGSPAVDGTD